jgi:hypothetical protein
MPDEVTNSAPAEGSPEPAPTDVIPDDFREYVRWRTTGETPPAVETQEEPPAAAAEETPQAKTVPESEPDEDQEPEEDEEGDEESSEEKPAAPKRPGSRQRRIDRLTRENEDLKRQIAEREKPPPKEKAAELPPGAPKLEDFETLEAFQWAVSKFLHEQTRAEEKQRQEVERVQSEWDKKEKKARKAHEDYDNVIGAVTVPEGPGVMAARLAMLEDEAGAEVMYHLCKRPKEMQRIASLDPVRAVMEIGRLSATVVRSSEVPENIPRITSAPKPPPAVGRPTKTASDDIKDPEVERDYTRWERLRMAELRSK